MHPGRHPDPADGVMADGGDRARYVCAVAVLILRVVIVGEKVPAVHVVDKAVAVVVDAVAGDLAGIRVDVGGQIRVSEVNAAVQNADYYRAAAGGDVPRLGRIDVGIGHADLPEDGLAGVVQAVQLAEARIVHEGRFRAEHEVGLHVLDGPQRTHEVGDGRVAQVGGTGDQHQSVRAELAANLQAGT